MKKVTSAQEAVKKFDTNSTIHFQNGIMINLVDVLSDQEKSGKMLLVFVSFK